MANLNISRGRGPFDAFQQAIRTAIPIYLQKKRLEFEAEQEDKEIERLVTESRNRQITELLKLKAKEAAAADKINSELYMKGMETGNRDIVEAAAPRLEQMGVGVAKTELAGPTRPGESLERYVVPEVPQEDEKFNENEMLWKASGGNLEKYIQIKQALKSKGLSLKVGADGQVTFSQGGPQTEQLPTKPMQTKLQEKTFNAIEGLNEISGLITGFKPELLEFGTRAKAVWKSFQAKLGENLNQEDTTLVRDYHGYQKTALNMINQYIKRITGAQMSEKEASRIRKALPDFGEHWWSGDDPISFIDALQKQHKKLKLGLVRYNLLLSEGLSSDVIEKLAEKNPDHLIYSLEEIEKIIQKKGEEYRKRFIQQGVTDPQELTELVKKQLKDIFGDF